MKATPTLILLEDISIKIIGRGFLQSYLCLKTSFNRFFNSWKNLVWFFSYVILKFRMSGFPLKIVDVPFWIDVSSGEVGDSKK